MIIKASQRGGSSRLAAHLLNANDNEHVTVHEIRGFIDSTLTGAMQEAYAVSLGTRCKQFLFSVSLNPPQDQVVAIEVFEDAAQRIEKRMGLIDHPRVIVFHEKHARRHAHIVWSRINAETMKAINLPYFKNKLMDIAREIHHEHGWDLPAGLIDRTNRNPLNFTLQEWQQAKRMGNDPKQSRLVIKECWSTTKSKREFEVSLERQGYYLAQGDKEGFVVVYWQGSVLSLSRQLGLKKRELVARLGSPKLLRSVDATIRDIDEKLVGQIKSHLDTLRSGFEKKISPLFKERQKMTDRHSREREALNQGLQSRWESETKVRQARIRKGASGLWNRLTGKTRKIKRLNEIETLKAIQRDRTEKDELVFHQLKERDFLQRGISNLRSEYDDARCDLQEAVFSKFEFSKIENLFEPFLDTNKQLDHDMDLT